MSLHISPPCYSTSPNEVHTQSQKKTFCPPPPLIRRSQSELPCQKTHPPYEVLAMSAEDRLLEEALDELVALNRPDGLALKGAGARHVRAPTPRGGELLRRCVGGAAGAREHGRRRGGRVAAAAAAAVDDALAPYDDGAVARCLLVDLVLQRHDDDDDNVLPSFARLVSPSFFIFEVSRLLRSFCFPII